MTRYLRGALLQVGCLFLALLVADLARAEELRRLGGKGFRQAVSQRLTAIGLASSAERQALIEGLVRELAPMHGAILERKIGGESRMTSVARPMVPRAGRSGGHVPRPFTHEGHAVRWLGGGGRSCGVGVARQEGASEIYRGISFGDRRISTMQTSIKVVTGNLAVRLDHGTDGFNVVFLHPARADGLKTEAHSYSARGNWKASSLWYRDGILQQTAAGLKVF